MKFTFMLLTCIALWMSSIAQGSFDDSIAHARNRITQSGMIILGSWAAANITSGFIAAGNSFGATKYAWRMNGYWNIVNLGLAGMGYLHARRAAAQSFSFADNYEAQHAIEKIYVLNFGLDLAYIASGFYFRERGKTTMNIRSADQLKGYGESIIAQGGFLLLMDGAMFLLHKRNTVRMNKKLRTIR